MSKVSEELRNLANNAVRNSSRRTIKLPAYVIENQSKTESKKVNNVIPIDSLKEKKEMQKKSARTLSLNLSGLNNSLENDEEAIEETDKKHSVTLILDSSSTTPKFPGYNDIKPVINLSSPFFYSPSVFSQYNIKITDADSAPIINNNIDVVDNPVNIKVEEDVHTEANRILEESLIATRKSVVAQPAQAVAHKKKASSKNVINAVPQKDIVSKKTAHKKKISNKVAVSSKQAVRSNEEHKMPKTKPISKNVKTKKIKVSAQNVEPKIDLDALISQDTVNEAYFRSVNPDLFSESLMQEIYESSKPVEIREVATVVEPAVVTEAAKPVGILVEKPEGKKTSKVKTAKASNFTSIFKKFSYDEADLLNSAEEVADETPAISNVNSISEVQQTLENAKINQEKSVTELNVQANPVTTIPVIDDSDINVIAALDSSNNYISENDINPLNVITPSADLYDSNDNDIEDLEIVENVEFEDYDEEISSKYDDSYDTIINDIEELDSLSDNNDINNDIITEDSYFNFDNDISDDHLLDDNADIEFDTETFYSENEDDNNEENIDDDIIIEDNDSELVEDSIFDTMLNDISLDDIDLEDLSSLTIADVISNESDIIEEPKTEYEIIEDNEVIDENSIELEDLLDNNDEEIESILEYAMSSEQSMSNDDIKDQLLTGLLGNNSDEEAEVTENKEITSDFLKVIDSLTQTITNLEEKNEQQEIDAGKAINIEIDKDDIFSISILNETYEIVADFDGISVLSENIHISTPKNNFFVKIGNKYIEIHNLKTSFEVYTNFEDIEFANALNNVAFTKKDNRFELNIKEAFKLSSIDNKVSLAMLSASVASIDGSRLGINDDESSICDNKTLVISEETQKVYLPYTIKDIMEQLNDTSTGYQTVQDVIDEKYTIPLSEFKMPVISRFKEAYKFMREKEKSSIYAAIDLALELMFNINLNPAIIRACKNLRELNIYLDCLYENELEKFDCFKIIYKVLPKIQ